MSEKRFKELQLEYLSLIGKTSASQAPHSFFTEWLAGRIDELEKYIAEIERGKKEALDQVAELEGREITREQIASIISEELEFANAWANSTDVWRERNLRTADRIRAAVLNDVGSNELTRPSDGRPQERCECCDSCQKYRARIDELEGWLMLIGEAPKLDGDYIGGLYDAWEKDNNTAPPRHTWSTRTKIIARSAFHAGYRAALREGEG